MTRRLRLRGDRPAIYLPPPPLSRPGAQLGAAGAPRLGARDRAPSFSQQAEIAEGGTTFGVKRALSCGTKSKIAYAL
jgi:hypothetical protein